MTSHSDTAHSTNSGPAATPAAAEVRGRQQPRLWTPPLVDLTPATSYGYDVIEFAEIIGMPLDEWQQWLVIHIGELLPDGRPRFRTVLVLVARQQGKTHLARVLTLYWLYVDRWPVTLGMSASRGYAKKQWIKVCDIAQEHPLLAAELPATPVRKAIGEECFTTIHGSTYEFAAANRRAGRSLTIDRVIADELREHSTWDAYDASSKAMNARPYAQFVAITNQGDDQSVVLDALREPALEYIETGKGDRRLGLFEWSSPPGSSPTDLEALAYANPALGGRTDPDALIGDAARAERAGGPELASFRTEVMCMRVGKLDPAIDPDLWADSAGEIADLAQHRTRVALCLDVALDESHASLVAAAEIDGITHVDPVQAWDGPAAVADLARDLPGIVARIRPAAVGWFPSGPAAALAVDLAERRSRTSGTRWPPRGVRLEPVTGGVTAACMALPPLVRAGKVRHGDDAMINAHVEAGVRLRRGDGWVFQRRGASPIDALYATAGAVHLARSLPPPRPPGKIF